MPTDVDGEQLVVLLDMTLLHGQRIDPGYEYPQPQTLLQQLITFLRAHMLLNEHSQQCVIALEHNSSPFLCNSESGADPERLSAALCSRVKLLVQQHVAEQQQQIEKKERPPAAATSPSEAALSAGLSRALCYINRQLPRYNNSRNQARPRVLALLGGADSPLHYIPVMNAIFAAQHKQVVIDALVLGRRDSAFMQQAAHLTGGLYLRPQHSYGLLQYLLSMFSADTHTRASLNLHRPTGVDFRASCFCHKNTIDTGWICSVCLSIFCKANMKLQACPTCGSAFKGKAGGGGSGGGVPAAQQQRQPQQPQQQPQQQQQQQR